MLKKWMFSRKCAKNLAGDVKIRSNPGDMYVISQRKSEKYPSVQKTENKDISTEKALNMLGTYPHCMGGVYVCKSHREQRIEATTT